MKRRIIQILSSVFTNAYVEGFFQGSIYSGKSKSVCVPGLNCYSCPGALGACPIGSLQAVLGSNRFNFSCYVFGLLILFGLLLGRVVCGFLCLFGLIQELLYKIPLPKLSVAQKIDRPLRYVKYAALLFPVILLPIFLTNDYGIGTPYFCQWICPAGTLEGGIPLLLANESLRAMIGFLFQWKFSILLLVVISSIFIYRPFCKYLCPLGAFYGLFNRISLFRMQIDTDRCTGCKRCEKVCPMQVPIRKNINDMECIRCGACKKACPEQAIRSGFSFAMELPKKKKETLAER